VFESSGAVDAYGFSEEEPWVKSDANEVVDEEHESDSCCRLLEVALDVALVVPEEFVVSDDGWNDLPQVGEVRHCLHDVLHGYGLVVAQSV